MKRILDQASRVANAALVVGCSFVAYRRGNDIPMVQITKEDQSVEWVAAPPDECAKQAIEHGKAFANAIHSTVKSIINQKGAK